MARSRTEVTCEAAAWRAAERSGPAVMIVIGESDTPAPRKKSAVGGWAAMFALHTLDFVEWARTVICDVLSRRCSKQIIHALAPDADAPSTATTRLAFLGTSRVRRFFSRMDCRLAYPSSQGPPCRVGPLSRSRSPYIVANPFPAAVASIEGLGGTRVLCEGARSKTPGAVHAREPGARVETAVS